MDELEIMRQQLDAMKHHLDTQQIINKSLLRRIMRSKASWLNRFVIGEIIMMPFLYLFFAGLSAFFEISQWYAVVFLICGAVDVFLDWRNVRIPSAMFGTASVLELKKFLLRQKKERFIQTCVMTPLVVIWLVLFFLAMSEKTFLPDSDSIAQAAKDGALIGGFIGGVIGLVVVILIYYRMQHTNDDLLRDIRELENDR